MKQAANKQQVGFLLSGDDVVVSEFIAVASKLTGLLKELETSMTGAQDVEWQIADLRVGSASIAMRPHLPTPAGRDTADAVIGATLEGLATVENAAQRPPHFTDEALRTAKSLVIAAKNEPKALAIFGRAQGPRRQVPVSDRLVAHVDALIGPATVAIGSVEGTLEALTIHDSVAFSIYDSITGHRVVCKCDRSTLDAAFKHLGNRVSVSGDIKYSASGDAQSIRVDAVHPIGVGPLPQPEDIRGLLSDHKIDIKEWAKFVRED